MRRCWSVRVAFAVLVVMLVALVMVAGKRMRLVIGNGTDQNAPALPNPAANEAVIAPTFAWLGFEVGTGRDWICHPKGLKRCSTSSGG